MRHFVVVLFALLVLLPFVEAGFVRVDGKYFTLDGNRWYPHGVNYFPSFYEEKPPAGQDRSWLQDVYYQQPGNREQIDRELDKLRDLGFNFLIIQGATHERDCDNLNDFLSKAGSRGLKVSIFMHHSDPLLNFILGPPTYQQDTRIIQQCNLAGNDAVFGYELDWEPSLEPRWIDRADMPYTERRRNLPQFKAQWAAWVTKNYGSISHAYDNWGYTPPRVDAGSDDAQCISHTIPPRTLVNIPYTLTFTMKNVGSSVWTPGSMSLYLLGVVPVSLNQNVAPGQEVNFSYSYPIPNAPGTQIAVYWQMKKNGRVFGDACSTMTTFVAEQPTYPIPVTLIEQTPLYTPTDQQFCTEGSWRPYAVAYHHFMNDAIGDAYRRMVNAYKNVDENHIVYAHISSPDFTWDPSCRVVEYNKRWAMAKYLDVIPEDFYALITWYNSEGFPGVVKRSGFRGGYDDVGKPVIAVEAGIQNECHANIGRCSQEDQTLFYQALYDMFLHSPFTGSALWWFTGRQLDEYTTSQIGSPVYNNYGIVENTTLNEYPSAGFIRGMSAAMRSDRTWNPTTDLVVDPDAYSSFQRFYRDSGDRYLALVNQGQQPRVLTICSSDSARVELACVGNRQNDGACPLKCLRSRFLSLEIKDKNDRWVTVGEGATVPVVFDEPLEARAVIENLQEARWLDGTSAGSVQIAAKNIRTNDVVRTPLDHDVAGLTDYETGSFVYSDGLTENTTVTFYLDAYQRSAFGERVNVRMTVQGGAGTSVPQSNTTNTTRPRPLPQQQGPPQPKRVHGPVLPKETEKKLPSEQQQQQQKQLPVETKEKMAPSTAFSAAQKQTLVIVTVAIVLLILVLILIFLIQKMRRQRRGNVHPMNSL